MTDNLNVVCVITSKDFFRTVLRECTISDTAEFVIVREFARDFIRALDPIRNASYKTHYKGDVFINRCSKIMRLQNFVGSEIVLIQLQDIE